MKRRLTFISTAFWLSAAFTLVACGGNDDESNNAAGITPDGKVDVTRAMEFKVNFGDYNSEEEVQGTRAAKTEGSDTLSREFVELGNGLLAEVTVQKDTAKAQASEQRPMTRALTDDTYTMLVYKGGVLQGEMAGVVSSGVFTATSSNKEIVLTPDTYDFVLFNSKVSRNNDNLTVNISDAGTALIGRTTYAVTATPAKQKITFNMKHAGSRMCIMLMGYTDIKATTTATLSSIDAASVPNTAVYNAATGAWSHGTGAAISSNLTFPASSEPLYSPVSATYSSRSHEYVYFLPSTNPSKLKLKFTGGSIYNVNMANTELNLSVSAIASMAANGSYTIKVNLRYNFLYLMSDGTTGLFKATTYGDGTKTPIGVVISRSNRLAIALKNANNGTALKWYKEHTYQQQNYRNFYEYDEIASFDDMDGYRYTWQANGSLDGITIKANQQTDYPAFYYAGNYGNELATELAAQGKVLSGGMETKKWHLPSMGEWKYVFTALGLGNGSALTSYQSVYNCFGFLANLAFVQVDCELFYSDASPEFYWSSSEWRKDALNIQVRGDGIRKYNSLKIAEWKVRPFIYY